MDLTADKKIELRLAITLLLVCAVWGVSVAEAQTPHLEAERNKNLGVAYLEENRPEDAAQAFRRVIELAPNEPLGYANLGIAYLRSDRFSMESALSELEKARQVDPANVDVLLLTAEVYYAQGRWPSVIAIAQKALERNPRNGMAHYYIYRAATSDRIRAGADKMAVAAISNLRGILPRNLAVTLIHARQAAAARQWKSVAAAVTELRLIVDALDAPAAQTLWKGIDDALTRQDSEGLERGLRKLSNVLHPTARFRMDLADLQPPVLGLPITQFSSEYRARTQLERPAGIKVRFSRDQLESSDLATVGGGIAAGSLDVADVDGDGRDELLVGVSNGQSGALRLWQKTGGVWTSRLVGPIRHAAVQSRFLDFNNDDNYDIVSIGPCGLLLLEGGPDGNWTDVTRSSELVSAPGKAVALIDADNEGDLDLCVAGTQSSRLWQVRPESTFRDASDSSRLARAGPKVQRLLATDHDDDMDTDLVVIDARWRLRMFDNQRHGRFRELSCGLDSAATRAVLAVDFDNDGHEDLLLVGCDGELRLQRNTGKDYAPSTTIPTEMLQVRTACVLDFDNDGWMDIAVAGVRQADSALILLRNQGDAAWVSQVVDCPRLDCLALESVDLDRDGDLDLVALERVDADGGGRIVTYDNEGGNANHWLRVRLRGLRISGSKNNLHGIGSKIEVKSGAVYQMQFARRETTHFGLADRTGADLLRVVWSNGVPQNRFHPTSEQTILEPQILKGSCPYLYCWDGSKFAFVTDTLAGAPLGLQVAEGVTAPDNPRELLTIARNKIADREGSYVFQYTSELWETVYLDEVGLWVVDHPAQSDVFTDQRFLPPPYQPPSPIITRSRVAPVLATDSNGRNVTSTLLEFDHTYPEVLQATRFQGVVKPHVLTLQFGDVSQLSDPALVLGCWIFWTDTSINVAISQSATRLVSPTDVEVWHPGVGWQKLKAEFGLPCGKDKRIVLGLSDQLFMRDARVRIRSESQIYWDQAFLVDRSAPVPHRITQLKPMSADLHRGGFSRLYRPSENGPHLYDYTQRVDLPVWMDMTGMTTRYGPVTELLQTADDCFVVFTGGDELTIGFDAAALAPLKPGWQRDFLFYSDGWEKDSDRNTVTGETVEPLPFHAMSSYPYAASESYPRDALHLEYLDRYQTRYIGPESFRCFVKDHDGTPPPPLPWAGEPGVKGEHAK